MSLDKYLANNTTEDNASFSRIMDETKMSNEAKMSQFFASRESSLALPSTENLLALEAPKFGAPKKQSDKASEGKTVLTLVAPSSSLVSHNSVHFVPDGTSLTLDELTDKVNKERSIDSSNTRFKRPLPMADKKRLKYLAQSKVVRYGADGKEINPLDSLGKETPNVAGFRFVPSSPSASEIAGGSDTPLMTWGQLGNTPQRISTDEEDTGHYTPYSATGRVAFHMPSPSHREELAYKLADSAGKRRAHDRQKQLDKAKAGFLSPAARRLLSSSSSSSKGINSPLLNMSMKPSPRVASVKSSSSLSSLHYQSPLLAKKAKRLGVLAKTPQRENPSTDVTADLLNLSANNR
ncbi:DiGeorge syndrome critical region protein 14 [Cichlidogyrus casuarinus]|uniref:DiGeorge syndrome critical region protein 14 n=1 Tax=Cichlidogyrus casuarinus TaxID=1844966 RepID=A0ABD2QM35_9PLAT